MKEKTEIAIIENYCWEKKGDETKTRTELSVNNFNIGSLERESVYRKQANTIHCRTTTTTTTYWRGSSDTFACDEWNAKSKSEDKRKIFVFFSRGAVVVIDDTASTRCA